MRGYHIHITLDRPSSATPSTSLSYASTSGLSSSNTTFVPKSLFEPLPSHSLKSTTRRNTVSIHRTYSHSSTQPAQHKDYRYGPIRIDWADLAMMDVSITKKSSVGKDRAGPATAVFVPHTKSGSTNLPEGVVHIYRDVPKPEEEARARSSSVTASSVVPSPAGSVPAVEGAAAEECDGSVVMAVLAVPPWMTPSDFLAFVAPAADGIAHLRMIRDSAPNRSMVVMKFRNSTDAAEFAEAYNGKQFNSVEPEICHVVHVLSVVIDHEDQLSQSISRIGIMQAGSYELPTCPVCLERMDAAVTGLVTVPCSHTFHCACLSKWGDSRCPVCRYSQTLLSSHPTSANTRSSLPIPFTANSSPSMSHCVDCSSTMNLWICLICGNIGCGRYGRAHAQAHYERTTHLYALELETQRVWDYAGDGYVHRLIQNKADGKLVELPSAASSMGGRGEGGGGGPSTADALGAEKIEAIGIEYSYLLTSQLDSQRTFYEEQTAELRTQIDQLRAIVESLSAEVDRGRLRAQEEEERRQREADARVSELEREKQKADKRAEKASQLARVLEKDLREERAVGEGLMQNLNKVKERAEKAEQETATLHGQVLDLQDQVRDVMFFLEAKSKIEAGEGIIAEAAGGSVEVGSASTVPPRAIGTKKKNKKG